MTLMPAALRGTETRVELARVAVLVLVTTLLWCGLYDRWTTASWETPLTYISDPMKGDVLIHLAWIKAAGAGEICPGMFTNVPELGAPFVANWDDFPLTEKPLLMLTGWLGDAIGLFAAANFAVMLGQVLAAVAFYAAGRLAGCRWAWAFAGGLVFAFSRYAFAHGLHHLTILYYWHVPLDLLVCEWIFRGEGITWGGGRFWMAIAVAFVTGVQNVYYTNLFAQFVLMGGLAQAWRRRSWAAALPAGAILAAAAGAFLLMNANSILYGLVNGGNEGAVVRNYRWMEVYALKLVDLVVPPPDHRLGIFADWGAGHVKEVLLSPGELPVSGYIGLAGLAAMGWLALTSARRLAERVALPLEALMVGWIIFYAGVGGANGVMGALGFQLFRSTTRYSIVVLALVLMAAARRLSEVKWRRPWMAYAGAGAVICVALWDQTPPVVSDAEVAATAAEVASDRDFAAALAARLPAEAMVFEIPVMQFPESPAAGMGPYAELRPYLFSRGLRFSFGSVKGRLREGWQQELAQLPLNEVVARLESYGFAAIYVDRDGYGDKGEGLIKGLRDLGRGEVMESRRKDVFCVLLKPAAAPMLPGGRL